MSGLAGIWNTDGITVDRTTLSAMSASLSHRGPDGESLLFRENAAFAYQQFFVTPESKSEIQPLLHPSGIVLVWDGRLDNREELAGRVGLSTAASDPDIVLSTYLHSRERTFQELDGDFAVVIFDQHQHSLFLARDVMGARTLYFAHSGDTLVFASEIKALLAHPSFRAEPDDTALAEWLYRIPDYSDLTRTFFRGMCSIPAGHVLHVTPVDQRMRRYWDFDLDQELHFADPREYVDAYREAFSRAVRKRTRSVFPVGITVSGGLDSSSVYCMAKELAKYEPLPDLVGVSFVSQYAESDESRYQAEIEARYGTVLEKIPLKVATTSASSGTHASWYSEGPYLRWDSWSNLVERVADKGCRVLLTGYFGDCILTNPQYILDLVAKGQFRKAVRHGRAYFGWWDDWSGSPIRSMYLYLRGYLIPENLRLPYHRIRRKLGLDQQTVVPWYGLRLEQAYRELSARAEPMAVPASRAHAKAIYHYLGSRLLAVKTDMESKMDAGLCCECAHPFRDRDLVSLVMSIPGEFVYQNGARGIHRQAMTDVLPESIRLRRTKAAFTDSLRDGAILDLDRLLERIDRSSGAVLGYLTDPPILIKELRKIQTELPLCGDAVLPWYVNDLVGLDSWLSEFFEDFAGRAGVP